MASIQKYETRSGSRWAAHWRDQADRQHKRVFTRRKDADAWLTEVRKAIKDGTWMKPKPTLMAAVFRAWSEDLDTRVALGEIRASTASTARCNLRVHLAPKLEVSSSEAASERIAAIGSRPTSWPADAPT